jgi:pimeloyl-ACP methyl ester carboxylesterase
VGYNWLRCNSEAAARLAQKIDTWIAEWKARPGYQCDKVILISHSMGGLVCRAYARQHPDKVLGVIHGVQPAVGRPSPIGAWPAAPKQAVPTTAR